MGELKRKHDYKKETIADVRKLISAVKILYEQGRLNMKILAMPQENSIDCYYNGMVFAHISDGKWVTGKSFSRLIDSTENVRDHLLDEKNDYGNLYKFLKQVEPCHAKDKERRCQQVISVHNIEPKKNVFSVCGFETSLSGCNGEIDMVIFNPNKHLIYLVEYKCTNSALNGKCKVIDHAKDYVQIINSAKSELIEGMVDAYNVLRQINGIGTTNVDRNKINVKILFLFTANNSPDTNVDTISLKRAYDEIKKLYAVPAISGQDKQNIFWEYAYDYNKYEFNPENFIN